MDDLAISPISLTRFNALGGYARQLSTLLYLEELEYFEAEGGNVIGIAAKDITDQDFGGVVMAQDSDPRGGQSRPDFRYARGGQSAGRGSSSKR